MMRVFMLNIWILSAFESLLFSFEFISFTSSVFSMKNDFNKSSISIYGGKSLITEMILLFLLKFSFWI